MEESKCVEGPTGSTEVKAGSKETATEKELDKVVEDDNNDRQTSTDLASEVKELRIKLADASADKEKAATKLDITREKDTKANDERRFKKAEKSDSESSNKAQKAMITSSGTETDESAESKAKLFEETKRSSKLNRELQLAKMKMESLSKNNQTCSPEEAADILRSSVSESKRMLTEVSKIADLDPPTTPEMDKSSSSSNTDKSTPDMDRSSNSTDTDKGDNPVNDDEAEKAATEQATQAEKEEVEAQSEEAEASGSKTKAVAQMAAAKAAEEAGEKADDVVAVEKARKEMTTAKEAEKAAEKEESFAGQEEKSADKEMDAAAKEEKATRDTGMAKEEGEIELEKQGLDNKKENVANMDDGPEKLKKEAEIAGEEAKVLDKEVEVDMEKEDKLEEEALAVDAEVDAESKENTVDVDKEQQKLKLEHEKIQVGKQKTEEMDEEQRKVEEEKEKIDKALPDGPEKEAKKKELDVKVVELKADKKEATANVNAAVAKVEAEEAKADEAPSPDSLRGQQLEVAQEKKMELDEEKKKVMEEKKEVDALPPGPIKDAKEGEIASALKQVEKAKAGAIKEEENAKAGSLNKKMSELNKEVEPLPENDATSTASAGKRGSAPEASNTKLEKLAAENKKHKKLLSDYDNSKAKMEQTKRGESVETEPSKTSRESVETEPSKTSRESVETEPSKTSTRSLLQLGESLSLSQPDEEEAKEPEASTNSAGDEAKEPEASTDSAGDGAKEPVASADSASDEAKEPEASADSDGDEASDDKEISKETESETPENAAKEAAGASPKLDGSLDSYLNGMRNWQDGFQGAEVISAVCAKLKSTQCGERIGCKWSATNSRCEDAAEWHCATKKTITDCVAQRELSPGYPGGNPGTMALPVKADKLCGKVLFGKKEQVFKQCKYGFRAKHKCVSDADCPGSECTSYSTTVGCASTIRQQCGSMGWQQITSSIT